jgi:hypothetical protein
MMKIDDFFKSGTPLGIVIGIGATVVAAAIIPALPALAKAVRPAARAALKTGILLAERGQEFIAEASEELEDMLAEVRTELRQEKGMDAAESSEFSNASHFQDDL